MNNFRRSIWIFAPICVAALGFTLQSASGRDVQAVDVPSGTMAFFANTSGGCPDGWRVANEATGRLAVGVTDALLVGKLSGTSLSNQEDRMHVHGFSAAVDLPYKSISALDGSNQQGAQAQQYLDSGMSAPAPSGLPFIQLVACVKP